MPVALPDSGTFVAPEATLKAVPALAVGAPVVGAMLVWPLALGLDLGRTTRSGPQAPNATTATDMKMAR